MEIGKGRPLCCFFWLFSATIALYVCLSLNVSFLTIATIVLSFGIAILITLAILVRQRRYQFLYLTFLSFGVLLGIVVSLLQQCLAIHPAESVVPNDGSEISIQGLVLSQEVESSYIHCYGVRMELPNAQGMECRNTMVYLSITGECSLAVGDRFCMNATVMPVTEADEQEWRIRTLRADGYTLVAYANDTSECTVLEKGHFVFREWMGKLQYRLSYRLSNAISGEPGKLVSALLLGTSSELSDTTVLDFRRAGASHLLALSGLHLSFIVLFITTILRLFRCPFRLRIVIVSLVVLLFLCLTGCSISTVRATVMLLWLNLSRLRGHPNDALTSLSVFFGGCLAVRPSWIYDAGLWLTVLATLAVIEIIPALFRCEEETKNSKKLQKIAHLIWKYILLPIISSCIILLVLIIPMALIFGEVSLLSPISNLLLTPLTSALLVLGLCMLPLLYLGNLMPFKIIDTLGEVLTNLLHTLADAMLSITERLSDVRGALLSLRYDCIPYLLGLLLLVFLIFLLFRWKRPKRFLLVLGAWTILFWVSIAASHMQSTGQWQATYTAYGNSELLCLSSNETTVLCDVTDGGYTSYRALFSNALPDGTTEIEALVLTHYHNRHISSVLQLMGDYRMRTIWLPMTMPDAPQEKAMQDEGILRSIVSLAKARRVEVRYYLPAEGAVITETLTLERLYYCMLKRSTHPTVSMRWCYRTSPEHAGGRMVWLGASSWEGALAQEIFDDISACDTLILALHGPIIKSKYTLTQFQDEPTLVLFTNGNAAAALTATPEATQAFRHAQLILAQDTHTIFALP